jgi:hypothetical protein
MQAANRRCEMSQARRRVRLGIWMAEVNAVQKRVWREARAGVGFLREK